MGEPITRLVGTRPPTAEECERLGVGTVFVREEADGTRHLILASFTDDGGYQQWGEERWVLGENVEDVTAWAKRAAAAADFEACAVELIKGDGAASSLQRCIDLARRGLGLSHDGIGPPTTPEAYLQRFPPEHRATADRAYQDGFSDGANDKES